MGADTKPATTQLDLDEARPFVLLSVVFAVCDLMMAPLLNWTGPSQAPIASVVYVGLMPAQIGLLATWGVFSSLPFLQRTKIAAAVGTAHYGLWAIGLSLVLRAADAGVVVVIFLVCPLIYFAAQSSLWLLRLYGWQVSIGDKARGSYTQAMSSRDLFIAIAAVSVALGLVRLCGLFDTLAGEMDEFLVGVAIFAAVTVALSAVGLLPLVCAALVPQEDSVAIGVTLLWAIAATAVGSVTMVVVSGVGSPQRFALVVLAVGTFAATLGFGLFLARGRGYRLRPTRRVSLADPRSPR